MARGTTKTNKATTLMQLGGASPKLAAGTDLNVYGEDGHVGTVTVTSGPSTDEAGSVLMADYDPLTPFPTVAGKTKTS